MSKESLFSNMAQTILDGDIETAQKLAQQSLDESINPLETINKGYKTGLDEIGRGFETGEYYLPDLVLAGKTMEAAVVVLEPALEEVAGKQDFLGKVLLATVAGDVHSIGKDLVALMLSLNGFEVVNIGHNVPTPTIVEQTKLEKPDIIGLSALLTTTTQAQRDVIVALEEAGIRGQVKVLIGGAATSNEWAQQIKADGYAEDAQAAVRKAKAVLGIE
ncbi:MAG: corrinoid protein [Anaerolineales bacterium]|nr:corrinoid protein [Anaerolineales bacterium]